MFASFVFTLIVYAKFLNSRTAVWLGEFCAHVYIYSYIYVWYIPEHLCVITIMIYWLIFTCF